MALQGKPQDWVGKEFRQKWSRTVVRVTRYGPGGAGRNWKVHYTYKEPDDMTAALDPGGRQDPAEFRISYVPYDPNDPMLDVPEGRRAIPPEKRKGMH